MQPIVFVQSGKTGTAKRYNVQTSSYRNLAQRFPNTQPTNVDSETRQQKDQVGREVSHI